MKLVSWNVNGLRAVLKKGFKDFFKEVDSDIFCIQETKMQEDQIDLEIQSVFNGYYSYWNSAVKKGYSGTAVFTKIKPINKDIKIIGASSDHLIAITDKNIEVGDELSFLLTYESLLFLTQSPYIAKKYKGN